MYLILDGKGIVWGCSNREGYFLLGYGNAGIRKCILVMVWLGNAGIGKCILYLVMVLFGNAGLGKHILYSVIVWLGIQE